MSWTRGQPASQCYYSCINGSWGSHSEDGSSNSTTPKVFTIISWNTDFMRILPDERMCAALKCVHSHVKSVNTPAIILFNEMTTSDLTIIQEQEWVKEGYYLTDLTNANWESKGYGTCALIPTSMPIKRVFRVHYSNTRYGRDALFVDISLTNDVLRVCSSHLESLRSYPPKRPSQLAEAARYMKEPDVHGSVLGGDLNAIEEFDNTLHHENGLRDAYLESGGQEGAEEGMTWGQMASTAGRNRYGLTRMDKFLYCGDVELDSFETFGMDVQVEREDDRRTLVEAEGIEKGWVTDHLGIKATFKVV